MGVRLMWTGATVLAVWYAWGKRDFPVVVGAVVMLIGCVLMWLGV